MLRSAVPSLPAWRSVRALLLAACLLLPVSPIPGAEPPELAQGDCGTPLLHIRYHHAADLDHACEAWRRMDGFLQGQHGLRLAAPVTLAFAERVELTLGSEPFRVLGHYDRLRRTLRVTSITAAWLREPDRLMFRLPIGAELHVSLIVHELAHAVLFDNFRVAEPERTGGEYLAYVVQLATMAPEMREQVLAQYEPRDFASPDEITEIGHLMRPHEFGVRAYRHFLREGHGYMLELILSGRLQADLPPM